MILKKYFIYVKKDFVKSDVELILVNEDLLTIRPIENIPQNPPDSPTTYRMYRDTFQEEVPVEFNDIFGRIIRLKLLKSPVAEYRVSKAYSDALNIKYPVHTMQQERLKFTFTNHIPNVKNKIRAKSFLNICVDDMDKFGALPTHFINSKNQLIAICLHMTHDEYEERFERVEPYLVQLHAPYSIFFVKKKFWTENTDRFIIEDTIEFRVWKKSLKTFRHYFTGDIIERLKFQVHLKDKLLSIPTSFSGMLFFFYYYFVLSF